VGWKAKGDELFDGYLMAGQRERASASPPLIACDTGYWFFQEVEGGGAGDGDGDRQRRAGHL